MIVSSDLEEAVDRIKPVLQQMQSMIDNLLSPLATNLKGYYEKARIKSLESIAAKVEKDSPKFASQYLFKELEDLLASTVVLSSQMRIKEFEEQIIRYCDIVERKSERQDIPEQFFYDDRHLILKFRKDYYAVQENPVVGEIKFEVQIKTHLQFALSKWSRETYKTSKLSWNLARLISQTRALVDLADAALARIEDGLLKENEIVEFRKFSYQNSLIELIKSKLNEIQLPDDMRRLVVTIHEDLKSIYKNPYSDEERFDELKRLLDDPSNSDLLASSSLTAYNIVFIALFRGNKDKMINVVGGKTIFKSWRRKILVTKEMLSYCPELKALDMEYKINLSLPELDNIP